MALAMVTLGSVAAQNNFRGSITYKLESTGETALQIRPEAATAELKVYDNKALTSSPTLTNNAMASYVLVDGNKMYACMDLSQLMMYLEQNEVELDYKGSSKILVSEEVSQSAIDSLTIPVTEGFYIEYVDETKQIAGVDAKKAIFHSFGEDGVDHQTIAWYNDAMGPAVNMIFNGLRGVMLEMSVDYGEGRQLTYTATEIKKGKVKEVDMLLPSGYEEISDEVATKLFQQIGEELKYLQEE